MKKRELHPTSVLWIRLTRCVIFLAVIFWASIVFRVLFETQHESQYSPNVPNVLLHKIASSEGSPSNVLDQTDSDLIYEYWKRGPQLETVKLKLPPTTPIIDQNAKFVTFEDDAGGWNNIRMAFEAYCMAARLTNRILVLPPPVKFYLLDHGPIQVFSKSQVTPSNKVSRYTDYFDLSAMERGGLRVITTEEFVNVHLKGQNIPEDAKEHALHIVNKNGFHSPWFLHLRERPDVAIWPSGPLSYEEFRLNDVTRLHLIASQKRTIHFPVHLSKNLRYLGGVPLLVRSAHPDVIEFAKVFTRNHLIYTYGIQSRAKLAVESSLSLLKGPGRFACLHIRRNELQYKSSFLDASRSLDNIRPLLKPNETLYIATDETAKDFFRVFTDQGFRVVRLNDILPIVLLQQNSGTSTMADAEAEFPRKYDGMLEQLVCSKARVFIGTSTSTFSSYINRLRMYVWSDLVHDVSSLRIKRVVDQSILQDIDLRCHFHESKADPLTERLLSRSNRYERTNCGDVGFSRDDGMFSPQ